MTPVRRFCRRILFALVLLAAACPLLAQQQQVVEWSIVPLSGEEGTVMYDMHTGLYTATNGVLVRYGEAVLTAERMVLDQPKGEILADGDVRIQQGEQFYASQHVSYNFFTHQMEAEQFRTGETPVFAAGIGLHGDLTNHTYEAAHAMLTTDDIAHPDFQVRARRIRIIPGKKMIAYDAVLYVKGVPVFYFPYYSRNIGPRSNNFNFVPGYRTLYGPFILGDYTWYPSDDLDVIMHTDYREKRGPGIGPDVNFRLGRWGQGSFSYYYTHDSQPNIDQLGVPIPENRQRVGFTYQANPATNFFVKSVVDYQSDVAVVRDFFETQYFLDPQPKTFVEANKFWDNFSLDAYAQPRVDNFLDTVERLPDIRLTGFRQQLGATPLYYESQSSAGYYEEAFANNLGTNGPATGSMNYSAARADTYHQVLLPETLFGWLNLTPRVGGRFTYYGTATGPGATTDEQYREVFNTGAELSFKASRLWPSVSSQVLDINGLRHIIEPSVNYVFVPSPSVPPSQLPQFDYELPSLRLLPLDFPEYNDIDSINTENAVRLGVRNKLQTKREGQVVNLLDWDLYIDWQLDPTAGQGTFSDLFSDLAIRPRSWLTLESLIRYDINDHFLRMSYTTITIAPNSIWSWRVGQYYLLHDLSGSPTALGDGNNVYTSTFYFKLNENWGYRMSHYFDAMSGRMAMQSYAVYRDLRSWTAALTFYISDNPIGPKDYTIAATFSLKAYPHFAPGVDALAPYALLGR